MNTRLMTLGCGGVTLFVLIILFALSFSTVEPIEYGLAYNRITKKIDEGEPYSGGRYCIGFTKKLIKFPRTQQSIEFSDSRSANSDALRTRTKEGLALNLHVNFQYQLVRKKIPKLYALSNIDFEQTFIRIARDIILQEAGSYEAPQYWNDRTIIGQQMQSLLNAALWKAYANCTGFQILRIGLPDKYEQSIVATQVESQKRTMKTFEQQAEIIRQETNIFLSECEQNVTVIRASANAESYTLRRVATAEAEKKVLLIESAVYKRAKDFIELSEDEVSKYILLASLDDKLNSTIMVGLDSTQIILDF